MTILATLPFCSQASSITDEVGAVCESTKELNQPARLYLEGVPWQQVIMYGLAARQALAKS